MITSFVVNRLTAVLFPIAYDKFWRKSFILIVFLNIFGPLVFTYDILTVEAIYTYVMSNDYFILTTNPVCLIYNFLKPVSGATRKDNKAYDLYGLRNHD